MWHEPGGFAHVWYRRPEQLKDERFDGSPESKYAVSEWSEFLEGFFAHIPREKWMNHPSRNAAASHKLEQLTTASRLGFKVPSTLATQDGERLRAFFDQHGGQIIVKPMAAGYVERPDEEKASLIYTNRVVMGDLENLDDLHLCPTLFQEFIAKEHDVRITVVDADIHSVALIAKEKNGAQRCDVRRNNMADVTYQPIDLPDAVRAKIRALVEHYGLRFAAIDMAVGLSGEWYFFEVNPNGQWAWLDMWAGMNITASFLRAFSTQ